jgi:hypothetical protein
VHSCTAVQRLRHARTRADPPPLRTHPCPSTPARGVDQRSGQAPSHAPGPGEGEVRERRAHGEAHRGREHLPRHRAHLQRRAARRGRGFQDLVARGGPPGTGKRRRGRVQG